MDWPEWQSTGGLRKGATVVLGTRHRLVPSMGKGSALLRRQNRQPLSAKNELRHICKHPRGILCSHIAVARLVRACPMDVLAFACDKQY
jgi:hypothetical protein